MNAADALKTKGFAIVPGAIMPEDLRGYQKAIELALKNNVSRARAPGLRNVFETVEAAREFAVSSRLRRIIEPVLGADYFAVRALIFDKTLHDETGANC